MVLRAALRAVVAVLLASVLVAGCGSSRPFVGAADQRELPTEQLSAGGELCPDRDLPDERRLALKRRGKRHERALLSALRRVPDAYVHTTYGSSDEGPGREDLTVRALAALWVRSAYCAPQYQRPVRDQLAVKNPD